MKTLKIFFWSIAIILLACQCRDDDEMIDPCEGLSATSAEFYIYPSLGSVPHEGWRDIDTDTISYLKGATFKAKYKADKYTWLIGSEELEDSIIFRQNFPQNESVTITLIVENFTPNNDCFPMDTGKDTLSRTFFADANFVKKRLWEGEFIGRYNSLPGEEHQFTLNLDSTFVHGLPYGECQHYWDVSDVSHSSVLFETFNSLDQTGRCADKILVFMTVDQDSFWLDVIGPDTNVELNGSVMSGVKLKLEERKFFTSKNSLYENIKINLLVDSDNIIGLSVSG